MRNFFKLKRFFEMEPPQPTQNPPTTNTTDVFKWLPILKTFILVAGSTLCFIIAYFGGSVSVYLPFISETGATGAAMCVFSMTLYLGAMIGMMIIAYRYLIVTEQISLRNHRLHQINYTSSIFGLVSMVGLVGVAAVPMSTILWLHLFFASIHFFFALVYVILQSFVNYCIPGGHNVWSKLRISLCVFMMVCSILLVIFFPLSHFKWKKANQHPPALKNPDDPFFTITLASCLFEWMLYATYLGSICSFYFDFRNYELLYGVVPRSPSTTAAVAAYTANAETVDLAIEV
ncbi:hypothetical protein JTE90_024307 [Oedothorax gibbosus]|uniref:CWH43-like N-terminal domain-containing protein n=1 Tax=Oedothorax gibbosus TaxID=931172 RepID=A0AAV6W0W1_9ARAC|nr:hypothetical protein JTE90_024307 [Oedothorax gibbosus]